ncbi:NAD(P)-binding protein [Trichoderma citrinoviride]|uniref:NAD(P)-binding protein n=1 Tax=Trichoderma citrinoviride TaxID=58853 RepID=A0A2T4BG31_9HYPO|nr:NAD(P)-binding protein [Trichoderma citrinoviride]PTB68275.1 NAD(P)-binding protein [Trichoderma citrinoviride]
MAPKVFVTGVTGYIGGTAFDKIYRAHPDNEYTILVRNEARAEIVKAKYPSVKFVYGGLDDVDVIEQAAAEADVVIHTADSADHAPSAAAIARGLEKGHTPEKPGYWIHLSGTGILTWYDLVNGREGEPPLPAEKYHDIDDIDRILNLDDRAPHRDVDKIVQAAASDSVKPAIICPPLIFGQGSGPGNTETIQIPTLVEMTLRSGFAPVVGQGKNEWDYVHVDDVGEMFLKLFEATQDPSKRSNPEIFGRHGYFYGPKGVLNFEVIAERVVEEIKKQGFLKDVTIKHVSLAEQKQLKGYVPVADSLGQNSKSVSQRFKKYFDWEPKVDASVEDDVANVVRNKAKSLGL